MYRSLGGGVVVLLIVLGCQTTAPPPDVREAIPPPFVVNGATVAIVDERSDWEREPLSGGKVTLYRLGRVTPNPWTQVARATGDIVAALPEKPERVEVSVTSFRLVRKEEKLTAIPDPSNNPGVGQPNGMTGLSARNPIQNPYDPLKSMTTGAGAVNANTKGLTVQNFEPGKDGGMPIAAKQASGPNFTDHPVGASCRMQATVRVIYPGGREKKFPVQAIAAGIQPKDSNYYGEALDSAANMAVRLYAVRFREAVGLPQE
jgi:hypothetical protein